MNINWGHVDCRRVTDAIKWINLDVRFRKCLQGNKYITSACPALQQVGKIGGFGGQLFNSLVSSSDKCCLILLCKKIDWWLIYICGPKYHFYWSLEKFTLPTWCSQIREHFQAQQSKQHISQVWQELPAFFAALAILESTSRARVDGLKISNKLKILDRKKLWCLHTCQLRTAVDGG